MGKVVDMTRDETKTIIKTIVSAYDNFHPQDMSDTIDLWTEMLKDYPYGVVLIALKAYIATDTSGFAPKIGQLIEKINTLGEKEVSDIEAWTMVRKAIENSLYHAEEEFNKLPPLVQKTVGSPSQLRAWGQTREESIESVAQSNFLRSYAVMVARDKQDRQLPNDIKALLGNIQTFGLEEKANE